MKTFSIVKTPLFTLILAFMLVGTIGISAAVKKDNPVKPETKVTTLTYQVWDFVGPQGTEPEDPKNPNQYTLADPNKACTSGVKVCQIYAPEDPTAIGTPRPDMLADASGHSGTSVEDRIDDAFPSNGTNETLLSYQN